MTVTGNLLSQSRTAALAVVETGVIRPTFLSAEIVARQRPLSSRTTVTHLWESKY